MKIYVQTGSGDAFKHDGVSYREATDKEIIDAFDELASRIYNRASELGESTQFGSVEQARLDTMTGSNMLRLYSLKLDMAKTGR